MKLQSIILLQMGIVLVVLALAPPNVESATVPVRRDKRGIPALFIAAIAAISAAVSAGAAVANVSKPAPGHGGGGNPPKVVCTVQRSNFDFCLRQLEELRHCPVGRGCCCEEWGILLFECFFIFLYQIKMRIIKFGLQSLYSNYSLYLNFQVSEIMPQFQKIRIIKL